MRYAIILYLAAGVVLLFVGFYTTGDCPLKNMNPISDTVFIVAWPVYLFIDVVRGPLSMEGWLHLQACQGGIRFLR
jgi:hypothetical protein